jgi:DNA-3-methyladenine glycosylase
VEAYRWPDDSANHCRSGRTPRNEPMWGAAGQAYVYLCYGMHHMLNLVTNPCGEGAAVLIRSVEPVAGVSTITARRGGRTGPQSLSGPGKVGAALGLDRSWSGHRLFEPGGLELRYGERVVELLAGPRVGIDYAQAPDIQAPWRLADGRSAWVSHRKFLVPQPALGDTSSSSSSGSIRR